jgi:hypothetical protein
MAFVSRPPMDDLVWTLYMLLVQYTYFSLLDTCVLSLLLGFSLSGRAGKLMTVRYFMSSLIYENSFPIHAAELVVTFLRTASSPKALIQQKDLIHMSMKVNHPPTLMITTVSEHMQD